MVGRGRRTDKDGKRGRLLEERWRKKWQITNSGGGGREERTSRNTYVSYKSYISISVNVMTRAGGHSIGTLTLRPIYLTPSVAGGVIVYGWVKNWQRPLHNRKCKYTFSRCPLGHCEHSPPYNNTSGMHTEAGYVNSDDTISILPFLFSKATSEIHRTCVRVSLLV